MFISQLLHTIFQVEGYEVTVQICHFKVKADIWEKIIFATPLKEDKILFITKTNDRIKDFWVLVKGPKLKADIKQENRILA